MTLSIYIEHPNQIKGLSNYAFKNVILDLPFCSIRSVKPHEWSLNEINRLQEIKAESIYLNMDGLYSDTELAIIKDEIIKQNLMSCIDGFRIQDVGLIQWLRRHFPHKRIHLNPEIGIQNSIAIGELSKVKIDGFTFNHETEVAVMKPIVNELPQIEFEIFAQGPILIQYSRRRFLSNLYNNNTSKPLQFDSEDPELEGRFFTFLDTQFGHFMFAHFHRSIAEYHHKLDDFPTVGLLIDARGQTNDYLITSIDTYSSIKTLSQEQIEASISTLQTLSKKPQKPSFFLSNNTDYDWRDEQRSNLPAIGRILNAKKNESILLEFFENIPLSSSITCINPDQTVSPIDISELLDLDQTKVTSVKPFKIYQLKQWQKGIQIKGALYLKDS